MLGHGLLIVETEDYGVFRTKFARIMRYPIIENNPTGILNKVIKLKISTVMDNFSIKVELGKS